MKIDINPYCEQTCRTIVEENFLSAITKKFGTSASLVYDKVADTIIKAKGVTPSPRGYRAISIFPCGVFYYLNYLTSQSPKSVIDVGCGDNLFKDIIPNLYGVDPNGTQCDENDSFDTEGEFSRKHYQKFDAAMSINALHFTSLVNFSSQIELFANIIKPGGRGFVGINSARMVERTTSNELNDLFGTTKPTPAHLEDYFDQKIKNLNMNLLVVDNFVSEVSDEWLDGNVRLVFEL